MHEGTYLAVNLSNKKRKVFSVFVLNRIKERFLESRKIRYSSWSICYFFRGREKKCTKLLPPTAAISTTTAATTTA